MELASHYRELRISNFFSFNFLWCKLIALFLRATALSNRSYEEAQMHRNRIENGTIANAGSKKVYRRPYGLSRKWLKKVKNPSSTQLLRKWSRFFIDKRVFDFAVIPYLLVLRVREFNEEQGELVSRVLGRGVGRELWSLEWPYRRTFYGSVPRTL